MNMTPWEHYQQDLQREGFNYDAAQEQAVKHLQALFDRLCQQKTTEKPGLVSRLKSRFSPSLPEPEMGLYFWGGVGRGKTYLMDVFFDCLPFEQKMRSHFHRFMQQIHRDLNRLEGEKNPLDIIARDIAANTRVICFDEFFVSDITDAMILGGLFEKLFGLGITLVATSNIIPDNLYKDGLQRERFLPAIAMLNKYTQVVNVDSGVDYRLRALEKAELYHFPLDQDADKSLLASFESLAPEPGVRDAGIEIEGRQLKARYSADDVVWFDFVELCDGPRSQNDYIELARIYHAVLVSNVPQLGGDKDDQARRFINLVDEFYDRNVKLVLSAEVSLTELYSGGRLNFEFERTESRLLEMQSHDYLAREHKP
jgi:cell division protein ZapE